MTAAVVFRPQAEVEFAAAQDWYEAQTRGLGQEFVTCVQATIERIRRDPRQFERFDRDVRRAIVRRFPYAVHYVADSESITIIAVFHTSRDPTDWRSRAR